MAKGVAWMCESFKKFMLARCDPPESGDRRRRRARSEREKKGSSEMCAFGVNKNWSMYRDIERRWE
jgi:hypothetical protein